LSFIKPDETFFEGVDLNSQVWMSHSDSVKSLPHGVKLASTNDVEFAAYKKSKETLMQYHQSISFY
jgi:GMP synthase (glutamine-hydrolysing)